MSTLNSPEETVCPRCLGLVPEARFMALSRTDNVTRVCSACGTHEALLQFAGDLEDQSEWPVEVPEAMYRANGME